MVGRELTLAIEKPAQGGRMIARHDGQVVLVAGAIPGERVTARVERVGRGVWHAVTTGVIEASPDRRPGPVDYACGGNAYAHIRYERQLALKSEVVRDALARIGHVSIEGPIPVVASPEEGYRMRARLHVRGGEVGFFREGTHDLCDPATTGQLLPETCLAAERLALAIRAARLDEVDVLEVSENIPATSRVVHAEVARPADPARLAALFRVPGLTGFTVGSTDDRETGRSRLIAGTPHIVETLSLPPAWDEPRTVILRRHVRSFFQGNRFLVAPLAVRVCDAVPPGPVADLYAGVGLFAIALAASGRDRVVAVEGDRHSGEDLRANARQYEGAVEALRMPVEQFVAEAALPPDTTLIVDPPRTGMSREAMDGVLRLRAASVVYVSCDVATLARDLGRLVGSGYRLVTLEAFDMFPNTGHVEALAVLSRSTGSTSSWPPR